MEFITGYHIDFADVFSSDFMENKMKEAIKFETCCDIRKTFFDGKHIFTCETKGPDCFTCEFAKNPHQDGFSLCGKMPRHKKNCQKEGEEALYIKTMMLLKLRREYLENFIEENQLIGQSPKVILMAYSRKRHNLDVPFYEEYLTQRGLIEKVKKKWANLMDSIRKAKTALPPPEAEAQHPLVPSKVDILTYFSEDTFSTPFKSVFHTPRLFNPDDNDKQNIFFEFKFDRVMQKPPEVQPFRECDNDTTCSAFGSLPACLINSSLEKQSLRETNFLANR